MSDCPDCAQLRRDAATVVHAYDCAGQLIDALINFLPVGQPLDSRVAAAKYNLDQARAALAYPAPPVDMEKLKQMVACLETAEMLIEALMTELRHAGTPLPPSLQLTAAHATWEKRMNELLKPPPDR